MGLYGGHLSPPGPQRHSKIFKPCCRQTLKCIIEILKLRKISSFILQIIQIKPAKNLAGRAGQQPRACAWGA